MPAGLATTFIELLIYTAPGLVVLYSLKEEFPVINSLLGPNGTPPESWAAIIPMLFMAIATGIVIAGITNLITGGLYWVLYTRKLKKEDSITRLSKILSVEDSKFEKVSKYYRTYEAYGRMAIALTISTIIFISKHFNSTTVQDGNKSKIIILLVFTSLMLATTYHSMRIVNRLFSALAQKEDNTSDHLVKIESNNGNATIIIQPSCNENQQT